MFWRLIFLLHDPWSEEAHCGAWTPPSLGRISSDCNYPPKGGLSTWDVGVYYITFQALNTHLTVVLLYSFHCGKSLVLILR